MPAILWIYGDPSGDGPIFRRSRLSRLRSKFLSLCPVRPQIASMICSVSMADVGALTHGFCAFRYARTAQRETPIRPGQRLHGHFLLVTRSMSTTNQALVDFDTGYLICQGIGNTLVCPQFSAADLTGFANRLGLAPPFGDVPVYALRFVGLLHTCRQVVGRDSLSVST